MLAMPLIVMNMGGEMVYILEQRLHAQKIPAEKTQKVLADVIRTMYSRKFITELFKPQEVYTTKSTREIFDRLAHSSIMRLNSSSMEKLFDLMTMGFKYQILQCSYPDQLLQVTLNHLEALKEIVKDVPDVEALVDNAIMLAVQTYGSLSLGSFHSLKQLLARFFQDRRVKVSLFLQDGLQNMDGTIVLNVNGCPASKTAAGGDSSITDSKAFCKPGRITYFDSSGRQKGEETFQNVLTKVWADTDETQQLGMNLYNKDNRCGIYTMHCTLYSYTISLITGAPPARPAVTQKSW
jgi:hypothetical protein